MKWGESVKAGINVFKKKAVRLRVSGNISSCFWMNTEHVMIFGVHKDGMVDA